MIANLKVLVVENNISNYKLIEAYFKKYFPTIEVLGPAKSSKEFVDLYFKINPDILLLDIILDDDKTSLETLAELGLITAEIIITSSFEQYALDAINKHSVSAYLLKPIDVFSFRNALAVAIQNIDIKRRNIKSDNYGYNNKKNIAVATIDSIDLIKIKDILYLEADGTYTVFYIENKDPIVASKNIGVYDKLMPEDSFFRIHHKFHVNVNKVVKVFKSDGCYCVLNNGKHLSIALRRQEQFKKFLNIK